MGRSRVPTGKIKPVNSESNYNPYHAFLIDVRTKIPTSKEAEEARGSRMFCDKSKPRQGKLHDTHTHYHTVNMNTNYPHALSSPSITPSHPSSPCHTRDSWLIRHYCHAPYHRRHTGLNYWPFFNKAMDCLRNGAGTAVDYIESLLFYILRMSDFCYLHPSTPARQRMAIDFRQRWMGVAARN